MEKVKLEILGLSNSQSSSGSYALVLGEVDGSRRLPIIIGVFEAQAIAIEIEKIMPTRPMTHDLFRSFANIFSIQVEEIIISSVKEGVFFAQIAVTDGIQHASIDARPSDAIAIAVRFGAPIFTYSTILDEAGILVTEEDEDEVEEDESGEPGGSEPGAESDSAAEPSFASESEKKPARSSRSRRRSDELQSMSVEKLQEMLSEALDQEDYERAARIRDELNKRN